MNDDPTLVTALVAAIGALATVIGFAGRQLWVKLFADDKGLFTKIAERHLRFVDESAEMTKRSVESQQMIGTATHEIKVAVEKSVEAMDKQRETCEKIETALNKHHEDTQAFITKFNSPGESYTTTKTNEAIHHLARAGRAHLEGHDDETLKELDAAEKAVEPQ